MPKKLIIATILVVTILLVLNHTRIIPEEEFLIPDDTRIALQNGVNGGFYHGVIVGTIDKNGNDYFSVGTADNNGTLINENTIFEIASISKLFTALLLADIVQQKKLDYDDPIEKFLPISRNSSQNQKQITVETLATHTSGLPTQPPEKENWTDFYTSYSKNKMYDFLNSYTTNKTGSFLYSNLGYTVLGDIVENSAKKPLEVLVQERITSELNMTHTGIKLSEDLKPLLATGFMGQKEVPSSQWNAPLGAGGFKSSANDLLEFLSANMGLTKTSIYDLMVETHKERYKISDVRHDTSGQGLGWKTTTCKGNRIVWHDGKTDGFRSFVGFDLDQKHGVVVLANSDTNIIHIGFHLLNSTTYPMRTFNVTELNDVELQNYVGEYNSVNEILKITKEGNKLFAQSTSGIKYQIYPEGKDNFFYTESYSFIKFERDEHEVIKNAVRYLAWYGDEGYNYCPIPTGLIFSRQT